MPIMNGIEMITKIREISKNITVLITSSDTQNFIDLIRLGIDGYILKPVEIKQFISIIQKVIEKLKNKQDLFDYKNSLEEKIQDKTKELQKLNENLEDVVKEEIEKNKEKDTILAEQSKMASLGEMIGNIAHQWRQPLSVISTGATGLMLQKECDILTDESFEQACNLINDSAQYLSHTIEDFKNFANDERTVESINLKNVINNLINLVDSIIKSNNITLILKIEDDIQLNTCANELLQCFLNIFNNSKDALDKHNITNKLIFITIKKVHNQAMITFKDNAGGIEKDILPKIFDPYFTTKHKSQGTGLGLNMTYRLIHEGMGGTIKARNKNFDYDNKNYDGAKFTISLPL